MRLRGAVLLVLSLLAVGGWTEGLTPERLGVIYDRDDPTSARVARYYAAARHVPAANMIGLAVPERAMIDREQLKVLRSGMLDELPTNVQSLLLVWSRPYAVECMSVTTAFAAGYQPGFCEPGCGRTLESPLYDTRGWLPADTLGWLPAMLLPSDDEPLARAIIDRGVAADATEPRGTVYLVRTADRARNVRAAEYPIVETLLANRIDVRELSTPIARGPQDIVGYFTGIARVEELSTLGFRPGAAADHLTSSGGALDRHTQMSALEWLKQGATASYGTVTEPCSHPGKFPSPAVFFEAYLRGDTMLEAYWKSVAMPGQGLFIGEPLSRPYAARP